MAPLMCMITMLLASTTSASLVRKTAESVKADGTIESYEDHDADSLIAMSVDAFANTNFEDEPQMEFAQMQLLETNERSEHLTTKVNEVVDEVEDMVRSGAAPVKDKIAVIKKIVDSELVPDLKATRNSAAKQVTVNLGNIDKCNKDALATLKTISTSTEVTVGTARKTHATCRKEHMDKHGNQKKLCAALDAYLNDVNAPASKPTGRAAMVSWVKATSKYFCPKGPEVTKLDDACTKATLEHAKHKAKCDQLQGAFELAFCTWRTQLQDACKEQTTCYDSALKAYNVHVAATKVLVKKWKTEYAALKKILCYVDVWLNNGDVKTVDAAQYAKCNGGSVDTSPMDVPYGTPAGKAKCDMTAVQNYPGTTGFVTAEYAAWTGYVTAAIPCLSTKPTLAPVKPTTTLPPARRCDAKTEVSYGGHCYYLDGSNGKCDSGYEMAPQSILHKIHKLFPGKTYKRTQSNNCCVKHRLQHTEKQDWGFVSSQCNKPGPFKDGVVVLGGTGCKNANQHYSKQLTLCQTTGSASYSLEEEEGDVEAEYEDGDFAEPGVVTP